MGNDDFKFDHQMPSRLVTFAGSKVGDVICRLTEELDCYDYHLISRKSGGSLWVMKMEVSAKGMEWTGVEVAIPEGAFYLVCHTVFKK